MPISFPACNPHIFLFHAVNSSVQSHSFAALDPIKTAQALNMRVHLTWRGVGRVRGNMPKRRGGEVLQEVSAVMVHEGPR